MEGRRHRRRRGLLRDVMSLVDRQRERSFRQPGDEIAVACLRLGDGNGSLGEGVALADRDRDACVYGTVLSEIFLGRCSCLTMYDD